jgi:hypothetical protein
MKDPWQSYLQLGIVHFMAFPECLTGEGNPHGANARLCCAIAKWPSRLRANRFS